MTRYEDVSPAGEPAGLCVVLPGRGYTVEMPLLTTAAAAAVEAGWTARRVWWEPPRLTPEESVVWVGRQLEDVLARHHGPLRVVAKSLGCYAAETAARAGADACWLTPVLADPLVAEQLAAFPGDQLVVGGTGDDVWDADASRRIPGRVVEVPGANHSMDVEGDVVATAESHLRVARALADWFGDSGAAR